MKLQEYQAKGIFSAHGIKIPKGEMAENPSDVKRIAEKIGKKVILKAQILVGGRGKAGVIKTADNPEDAEKIAQEMFGKVVKGHVVRKIYVEKALDIQQEFYVGVTVDRVEKAIAVILSTAGGMDVEEIAAKFPEKIAIEKVKWQLYDFQIREMLRKLKIPTSAWQELTKIVKTLYEIFLKYEAELVEINPLALTKDGFFAADAKLNIDDNAIFRHKEFESLREYTEADEIEKIASQMGLNYVKLDGDIGIVANGAGMAMATMDLVYLEGGRPANFLDVGGGASADVIKKALEVVTMDKAVKVVFINVFGGITRCDEVAIGIKKALSEIELKIPIVVRLSGTNEEEGLRILREFASEMMIVVNTMEEGAKKAVEVARWQ